MKDRAWELMSQYVRRIEKGVCFTCGNTKPWKEQDAGHFKHGRLDYDLMNIHCQCRSCNSHGHGKLDVYYEKMIEKYGLEKVQWLTRAANKTRKYTIVQMEAIIQDLKEKIKVLNLD
jgi:hypothetical protein